MKLAFTAPADFYRRTNRLGILPAIVHM
jgi:hypothetical protein